MKNQLLYGGILLLATACSSPKNFSVEDGNTFIVIDEKASVPSVLAAHELQHFVQQASGIELPIVNNAPSNGSKLICVGESPYTAEFDTMKLGEQEYFIKVSSDKVVLMGQDENTDRDDGRDNTGLSSWAIQKNKYRLYTSNQEFFLSQKQEVEVSFAAEQLHSSDAAHKI